MHYLLYDTTTGKIFQKTVTSQTMLPPLENGQKVLLVSADEYQSVNTAINFVDPVTENILQLPDQPSDLHVWDWASFSWFVDASVVEDNVRQQRDQLLALSDWTQLPDVPLATKEAWAAYRQALRDISLQPGFPVDVVWPTAPA